MQGRSSFLGSKKIGIQKNPFKRLISGITCKSFKNLDRLIPCGSLCYKP